MGSALTTVVTFDGFVGTTRSVGTAFNEVTAPALTTIGDDAVWNIIRLGERGV